MDGASLCSQGQAEVNRGSPPSTSRQSPPLAFLAEIRPKIRLLAVGFNGQIRKGTPFSLDSAKRCVAISRPGGSAKQASVARPLPLRPPGDPPTPHGAARPSMRSMPVLHRHGARPRRPPLPTKSLSRPHPSSVAIACRTRGREVRKLNKASALQDLTSEVCSQTMAEFRIDLYVAEHAICCPASSRSSSAACAAAWRG